MRTLIKVGVGLLLLSFVLIAVAYGTLRSYGGSSVTSPTARFVRSEERPVSATIDTVDLSGPINLTLTQGPVASLQVRGEQRLLANVETVTSGSVLHIRPKGMLFHHREPLQVVLVLPELRQFDVDGSGESSINGFSGEQFKLTMHGSGSVSFSGRYKDLEASANGSGDLTINGGNSEQVALEMVGSGRLTASGSSQTLRASLTGSGDLDAEHLASDSVTLTLQGSGSADVFAKLAADLTLRGSGDIKVYGNPEQRNEQRTGSGEVKWE
jgi:hypothetical protein